MRVALVTASLLVAQTAFAQTQIHPRVMIMVDTSGSMSEHFMNTTTSGGDGSTFYTDSLLTRSFPTDLNFSLYVGKELTASNQCTSPSNKLTDYDGINSRMFAAKTAVTNVLNASGDIDWGLMRYTGSQCPMFTATEVPDPTFSSGGLPTNKPCTKNSNCPGSNNCLAQGFCACSSNGDCSAGGTCNASTGWCSGGCTGTGTSTCLYGHCATGKCVCGTLADCPFYNESACTGGQCMENNFGARPCTTNGQCGSNNCNAQGHCVCANDGQCDVDEFCVGGICGVDNNMCSIQDYGATDTRGAQACGYHNGDVTLTYAGSCGTGAGAGAAACATPQTCVADGDCNTTVQKNQCATVATSGSKQCICGGGFTCAANYTCTGGVCVYNKSCQSVGGQILVDPATQASSGIFPFVDGVEDYRDAGGGVAMNPELRAVGSTPLAGAARSATTWYNAIKNAGSGAPNFDAKISCRPYVLVQITDGFDTCDNDGTNGPVAAAQGFTGATVSGAKTPNKVYVIGLAFGGTSSPTLDAIAKAGGTGTARLANSQQDIEAALSDIISSSVLVEKCNNADDDCNGVCDEPFPDVALSGTCGTRAAKTCDNGQIAGTHCFATGSYVCSTDTLSEVCSAPTCATNAALCPTAETCNGQDDDCNGVIDDCTPFVAKSCCKTCPACNTAGVPQPETCNGCDDDCDNVIDDNLTDTGIGCGSNVGICTPGQTTCCTAATGVCTAVLTNGSNSTTGDTLRCQGGTQKTGEVCDGLDEDCNGIVDDGAGQACYDLTGSAGVGICKAGTQACTAMSIPPGTGTCPSTGFMMSGKNCPGAAMYGVCTGEVGPQPEICNNIDDNCNNMIDDNVTDPWAGQPCCPTGNNADCMGGGACMLGKYVCMNGTQACMGGTAKSTEVCNGIDDDCNGVVDDVAGLGANCTATGLLTQGPCKAQYQCAKNGSGMVVAGPGPNGLTCVQTVGPTTELCNGVDDDCDGTIDDNLNDPKVGVKGGSPCLPLTPLAGTSFPSTGPAPPCDPGPTACKNGMVVCQGEVFPMPNQCNGISTDCTGMVNMNGNCPSGFMCYMGTCVLPCSGGEFPCPGGFICDTKTNLCVPDQCQQLNCPAGQLCQLDTGTGKFVCVDPCTKVTCPSGTICKQGVCTDASCKTQGCPTGQVCVGTPPMCQTDPCAGVTCPAGQFCDNGTCESPCKTPCQTGYICTNGTCVPGPCVGMKCDPGFTCVVMGSNGTCVVNMCGSSCGTGQVCCQAACNTDPCSAVQCPGGAACKVDPTTCNTSCITPPSPPADSVVGEGGGGAACAMVGASSQPGALILLCLVFLALALRRRVR